MENDSMIVRHVDLIYTLSFELFIEFVCEKLTSDAVKSHGLYLVFRGNAVNAFFILA